MNNKWNPEKRHLCELCHVWMPPTKASIASHERSAQHVNNVNSALSGSKRRNVGSAMSQMIERSKLQYKAIEQAAMQKFNASDSAKYRTRYTEPDVVPPDPGISDPIIYEPTWSSHFDEEGKVYYYSRKSKQSTYNKPKDFDGYDPNDQANNVYLNTFTSFKATPFYVPTEDKGILGGWKEVDPKEKYFEKQKVVETEEDKLEREKEKERLRQEITNVHRGVPNDAPNPEEKKEELNLKLSKEAAPEEEEDENDEKDEEQEEEDEDESEEGPEKRKKVEDEDEKNYTLKKKTEYLREVTAKQTIEFVEKPTYHEEVSTGGSTEFKKRTISKGKRKAPESSENPK